MQAVVPCFEIGTGRLRIDLASRADWKALHAICRAPENYTFEVSSPMSERQTRSMLRAASFPRGFRKSRQLTFRVVETGDARVIGLVTVEFILPYYEWRKVKNIGRALRVLEARSEGSRVCSASGAPGVHAPSTVTALAEACVLVSFSQSFWRSSGARRAGGSGFPGVPLGSTPGYLCNAPVRAPEHDRRRSPCAIRAM